jgi:hypothetical protein
VPPNTGSAAHRTRFPTRDRDGLPAPEQARSGRPLAPPSTTTESVLDAATPVDHPHLACRQLMSVLVPTEAPDRSLRAPPDTRLDDPEALLCAPAGGRRAGVLDARYVSRVAALLPRSSWAVGCAFWDIYERTRSGPRSSNASSCSNLLTSRATRRRRRRSFPRRASVGQCAPGAPRRRTLTAGGSPTRGGEGVGRGQPPQTARCARTRTATGSAGRPP